MFRTHTYDLVTRNHAAYAQSYHVVLIPENDKNGQASFYVLTDKVKQYPGEVTILGVTYLVCDYHITVFELTQRPRSGRMDEMRAYHLTVNLKSKQHNSQCKLHVYYNREHYLINMEFSPPGEAKESELLTNDSEPHFSELLKIFQTLSNPFSGLCLRLYVETEVELNRRYDKEVVRLQELSRALVGHETPQSDYTAYLHQLEMILKITEEGKEAQLEIFKSRFAYFFGLTERMTPQRKPQLLTDQRVVEVSISDAENDSEYFDAGLQANTRKMAAELSAESQRKLNQRRLKEKQYAALLADPNKSTHQKIIEEHQLVCELYDLTPNGDLVNVLKYASRRVEIESKEARTELLRIMHRESTGGDRVSREDVIKLLNIIPVLSDMEFSFAYRFKRKDILDLMLAHATRFNLDAKRPMRVKNSDDSVYTARSLTYLELAIYEKNDTMLEFFLQRGAYCDPLDEDGHTPLMKACLREEGELMVLLLKAGASIRIRDPLGYTAFGHLTMRTDGKQNLKLIHIFSRSALYFTPDFMQGPVNERQTPLAFACQHNFGELACLLLKKRSQPLAIREEDFLTSVDICAIFGRVEILSLIAIQYPLSLLSSFIIAQSYVSHICDTLKLALPRAGEIRAILTTHIQVCRERLAANSQTNHDPTDIAYVIKEGCSDGIVERAAGRLKGVHDDRAKDALMINLARHMLHKPAPVSTSTKKQAMDQLVSVLTGPK